MSTPRFTSCLSVAAAMLFAASVQAGEISMDAGGYAANSAARASDNGEYRDCNSAPKSIGVDRDGPSAGRVASAAVADRLDSDNNDAGTDDTASSGSSPANASISVPIKARSNRWQSLVPGAIK